ncbi:MAG: lysophospholipid acyltransferase family protein [Chthoniobacteraceae bacterium]
MSPWKRLRFRLEAAGCRLLAWWIPRLSRDRCVRLANALGEIGFRLDRRGRTVALANVECALGPDVSPAQRDEIVRASYRNFVRTMLDLFWAPALARPENRHWLRTTGWEHLRDRLDREERGAVLLTLHYGHWEWASLAAPWDRMPSLAVAEQLKNPGVESVFKSLREVSGQTIIPQERSMLRMLREVKRGGTVAFLADLTVAPDQASAVIRTFGLEMCVSVLHGIFALRGNALVVPAVCIPQPDGSALLQAFEPLEIPADATLTTIAQLCWDSYEPLIRANPGLWLWSYKHFRYRPAGSQTAYPFYANEWHAFDELRRARDGTSNGN